MPWVWRTGVACATGGEETLGIGCWLAVADAGGESSHNRSLIGSAAGGTAAGADAMNGDAPCIVALIEGGTRLGGSVPGISFPVNLPWIRCMAIANPSRVRCPSLLRSAKSLQSCY